MHLHLIQLDIAWEDKQANHDRVRRLVEASPPPAGSLVLLPEMFDAGFSMHVAATAQSAARESEAFLRALARDCHAAVLGGVAAPLHEGRSRNEAAAFAPDGSELLRYVKRQPFTPMHEHLHYPPGDRCPLATWHGATFCTLICYDLRFPELFRQPAREGATLMAVIANWPEQRAAHWRTLLQARAVENQAYVVGVNRCGSDPYARYRGGSIVFDPQGVCLAEADDRPQVLGVEIDPAAASDWRGRFPALRDARFLGTA